MRRKLVKSQAFPGSRFGNKRLVGLMSLEDFCPQARRLGYNNPSPGSSSLVPRAAASSGWSHGHRDRAPLPPPHLQSQGWHHEGHPPLGPPLPPGQHPSPPGAPDNCLGDGWEALSCTRLVHSRREKKALGFLQSNS